ncbi:MAG: GTPase ObgE [Tissierellia bacterium]|nr:GTPase ObgE [Tissierellia bacterium]
MFVDIARIDLKAGKGGDGAVAFRREKFEPSGGPFGGDGGKGGDIIFVCDEGQRTLSDFKYRRHYKAENGENGRTKMQYGKDGQDLYLKVPKGTLIKDFDTDQVIYDMKKPGDEFIICKGGRGGKGNAKFKSSTRQAPRFAEPGGPGEEKTIKLEIKLLSDVGLVGLPNVGKSTILSIMTNANPKIANYHFTTLNPNLGVVEIEPGKSFVMADIPGLIEGASDGKGIGMEFLKHIERCAVLVHVLDISGHEGRDPLDDYRLIREEMGQYNERLKKKKEIIVANKMDLPGGREHLQALKQELPDHLIIPVSAATTENMEKLKYTIWNEIKDMDYDYDFFDEIYVPVEEKKEPDYQIKRVNDTYVVEGPLIDHLIYRTDFNVNESLKHFQKVLIDKGIVDGLREKGIEEGQIVVMGEIEFEYYE